MFAIFILLTFFEFTCISAYPGSRIVNGTNVDEGEFPFVASLRPQSGEHMCGCTILNDQWFLTAAHCVHYRSPYTLNIQYGVTRISLDEPQIRYVSEIVVHEKYDPEHFYENDIAVVRVMEPIRFSETVQPVKLPQEMKEVPSYCSSTLIGWGRDKTEGVIQRHLQKADLNVFPYDDCQERHNGRIYPSNVCAGVPEGGKGQCTGDSGGPLMYHNEQIGIVSWSEKPCTIAPYPGVLTKVSYFVKWIREKVGTTY